MKLSPDEIDYEQLKRKEESENHFYVDCVEEDRAEEHIKKVHSTVESGYNEL